MGFMSLNFHVIFQIFIFQLKFFEVSEFSFAPDLVKSKEGIVKKQAGGDSKRAGIFRCIGRGFRFIFGYFLG